MNFELILKYGFDALTKKLPEKDKAFLHGFQAAIDSLECFKDNMEGYIDNDVPAMEELERAFAREFINQGLDWMQGTLDEMKCEFITRANGEVEA